jgi:protein-S-isoprenylcysteine O-methyltransferase Ste14
MMLILNGAVAGLFSGVLLGGLPVLVAGLVPGGTWVWPAGLWFLAAAIALQAAGSAAVAAINPAAYRVRLQGVKARRDKRQPIADVVITAAGALGVFGVFAFAPVDVFWLKLLPPPTPLASAIGAALVIAGHVTMLIAIAQNEFAAPTVQDQTAGGQRVIDTGLYAFVRHPMYAGFLPFVVGIPLWLGSWAGVIAALAFCVLFLTPRIAIEEGLLRKSLPGYADYCRRVRARLIPFLL